VTTLPERQCWRALSKHHEDVRELHLRELFAADPGRGERFVAKGAGLYLDYSKNRITAETIRLLLALADECALHDSIAAMFRGERINV
jgi:glucose-6-phosphate isomerase